MGIVVPKTIPRVYPLSLPRDARLYLDMEDKGIRIIDHACGNHGTPSGVIVAGIPGGTCRFFDGTDDYIGCGAGSSLNLSTEGTLEAWVRPNRNQPSDTGTAKQRGIINKGNADTAAGTSYKMFWSGTDVAGTIIVYVGDGTNYDYLSNYTIAFGQLWTHVVMVLDLVAGKVRGRLFVNGVQVATRTSATLTGIGVTARPVEIGRQNEVAASVWSGWIGQVSVYTRAMTAAEVQSRFRETAWMYGVTS